MPVDGGQRNANLRSGPGSRRRRRRCPTAGLAFDGVTRRDPLRGPAPAADSVLIAGSHYLPGRQPRRLACAYAESAVQDWVLDRLAKMTGLDLGSDKLIEISRPVTDADLVGDGVDVVMRRRRRAVGHDRRVVADTSPVGADRRVKGILGRPGDRRAMVLDPSTSVKRPKTAPLADARSPTARSSPATCPRWFLHYRMIDVSSIRICAGAEASADLLQPAAQGADAQALTGIHPRTAVLPLTPRLLPQPRPFYQRNRGRRRRAFRRGGRAEQIRRAPQAVNIDVRSLAPAGGRRPW